MPKKAPMPELPFGRILRSVMRERNLTLKQIADLAGVSISVVQNWGEGKTPHDLKAVAKLAEVLGLSFKAMLLGEEEHPTTLDLANMFESESLIDGVCRIKIERLTPKKIKS
jgi:transcriptional regulator with XRE-family HTH domain